MSNSALAALLREQAKERREREDGKSSMFGFLRGLDPSFDDRSKPGSGIDSNDPLYNIANTLREMFGEQTEGEQNKASVKDIKNSWRDITQDDPTSLEMAKWIREKKNKYPTFNLSFAQTRLEKIREEEAVVFRKGLNDKPTRATKEEKQALLATMASRNLQKTYAYTELLAEVVAGTAEENLVERHAIQSRISRVTPLSQTELMKEASTLEEWYRGEWLVFQNTDNTAQQKAHANLINKYNTGGHNLIENELRRLAPIHGGKKYEALRQWYTNNPDIIANLMKARVFDENGKPQLVFWTNKDSNNPVVFHTANFHKILREIIGAGTEGDPYFNLEGKQIYSGEDVKKRQEMIIRTLSVLGGGDGSADDKLNNKPIDLSLLMVKNHKGEIVRWEDYKDEFGKWYREESDLIQQDASQQDTPDATGSASSAFPNDPPPSILGHRTVTGAYASPIWAPPRQEYIDLNVDELKAKIMEDRAELESLQSKRAPTSLSQRGTWLGRKKTLISRIKAMETRLNSLQGN